MYNGLGLKISVYECPVGMHAYMTEEGIRQKRASEALIDGCEPPCGCWELNLGPPEEQPMFLSTEQSLHPPYSQILWRHLLN